MLEAAGEHVEAADAFARAAAVYVDDSQMELGKWLISKAVLSLENARADNHGPNNTLDALVANLRAVDAALPQDAQVSADVQQALLLVERFRRLRDASGT